MKPNIKLNSLVLLAGFSKRMGQPKQHMQISSHTFLEIILQKLKDKREYFAETLFVGQQNDTRSQQLVYEHGGLWFNNYSPEEGPLSSIRIAVKEAEALQAKPYAVMLWPVDHPMVHANTIEALIRAFMQNSELITVPSNDYRRGHPTIFPAWCAKEFFKISLNEGARQILRAYPDRINHVLTNDVWVRKNINDASALAEARNASKIGAEGYKAFCSALIGPSQLTRPQNA